MHIRRVLIFIALIATVLFAVSAFAAGAESVPRMSTDELKSRLGDADLAVLDVRTDWDWNQSAEKIAGATHVNPAAVEDWAGSYPKERTLVLYCS
jgi:rhodanese-related sulfurtransferase